MPALGSNLSSTKDAESTDLSSLLNVLQWMNDGAFLGKVRVSVDLVRKLRSQRNPWAHAPKQELSDDEKAESFSIATDFLEDLEKVSPHPENAQCLEHLEHLKTSGVINVVESELQSLLLQRHLLNDIKEITTMKAERSSDKSAIEEHEQKLMKLECALSQCSQRMSKFERFKENINKQFDNFAEEWKSFRAIPEDIHEIRNSIGQIRDDLAKMNERQKKEQDPTSCLPDKSPKFTAREAEIQKVITFLKDEGNAVVSLHGGPGFGKTAIAIEVSHKLSEDHNILTVFSELATATTVDEMILQLCLDVGVKHHEDDPKQSLISCLKKIEKKVVLVMDDIDNLLEEKNNARKRCPLYEFIRFLRKNSNCQIVTTSRSFYLIPELSIGNVDVEEMEDKACMELLRKQCPKQDDKFLRRLAELCGKIPLAMCIASSRVDDFKNSDQLLQHLQKRSMKVLKCPESDQYVYRAINMSYEKCSSKEKETLLRLAAFEGNFGEDAARVVIEKDDLDTTDILKELFRRSLIKQPTKHRYSIHLLINHFLKHQQENDNETAERARAQMMRAEVLMVKYYLELGHDLTMKSYSKDGYKANREASKHEAHNIQNVLKICCQQKNPKSSDISDCLAHSKVYSTSARHFSLFVRTIIPGSTVNEFLQRCANLAKERTHHDTKLNFDCLLAEQKRSKAVATDKPNEFFKKMEAIEKEIQMHYKDLNFEENKSLGAHYHYLYGRYLTMKSRRPVKKSSKSRPGEVEKSLDLQIKAREHLEKSLELRKMLLDASAPVGITLADKVWALLQLGYIWKAISETEYRLQKTNESKDSSRQAEEYYREAVRLSEKHLDKHELTSTCYKYFGDLFLANEKYELAVEWYIAEKEMRKSLGLELGTRLPNNLAECLMESNRANEAIEVLERARDTVEKKDESDKVKRSKAKIYASLAKAYNLVQNNSEAVKYAHKALELQKDTNIINRKDLSKLHKIVSNNLGNN